METQILSSDTNKFCWLPIKAWTTFCIHFEMQISTFCHITVKVVHQLRPTQFYWILQRHILCVTIATISLLIWTLNSLGGHAVPIINVPTSHSERGGGEARRVRTIRSELNGWSAVSATSSAAAEATAVTTPSAIHIDRWHQIRHCRLITKFNSIQLDAVCIWWKWILSDVYIKN